MKQDKFNTKLLFFVCSKYILLISTFLGRSCEKQNFKRWMHLQIEGSFVLMRGSTVAIELILLCWKESHDKQYWDYWIAKWMQIRALPDLMNKTVKNRSFSLFYVFFHSNSQKEKISLYLMGKTSYNKPSDYNCWTKLVCMY